MHEEEAPTLHTKVLFRSEARKKLYEGLKVAAEAVMCTLGPKGKTVIIQQHHGRSSIVTKDGVTVSRSIRLKDPVLSLGAGLIKEAASQTNDVAGDGTTTATVLTHALVTGGLRLLEAGYPAKEIKEQLEVAVEKVDKALLVAARQLNTKEQLAQVATVSANGDVVLGTLIADAMERVGKDGIVTVEDAKGMQTTLDVVDGMRFDRGYLSPYFVTNNDRMNCSYEDVAVMVTDKKLSSLRDLIPLLEAVVQQQRSLLIIADDVEGEALQGLVLNRLKSNLKLVAVKAPGFGSNRVGALGDICCLTGATLVSSSTGVELKGAVQALGKAKRIIVDRGTTTIVGSVATNSQVGERIEELRSQLEDVTLSPDDATFLRTRLARLSGGIAVIRVGGTTEVEMVERRYRIEDALNATRAAAQEGTVPGGGMALLTACKLALLATQTAPLDAGEGIVKDACEAPLRCIATNAGVSPDVVISELDRNPGLGYNAATNSYVDMNALGIVDPVKVTRTALKNAASVAATFITLDAVVYEDK